MGWPFAPPMHGFFSQYQAGFFSSFILRFFHVICSSRLEFFVVLSDSGPFPSIHSIPQNIRGSFSHRIPPQADASCAFVPLYSPYAFMSCGALIHPEWKGRLF